MSAAPRKFRFGLQAKVLTAVVGFLVLLPALTFWIVNRQLQRQMDDEALRTLTTAEAVFVKSLENRTLPILARYRAVAAEARFKVTANLRDQKTMDGRLGSVLEDSPEEHDAILYLNEMGETVAGRRRASSIDLQNFARAAAPITGVALSGKESLG